MGLLDTAASLAEDQLGLVARRQLLERGVPSSTIGHALGAGRLRPIAPAVYRIAGAPVTVHVKLLAAVLSAGPGAVTSHHTAAWLWELAEAPTIHTISVPRGRRLIRPRLVVHESRDLHLANRGEVRGVPVTSVGRSILDCGADPDVDLELLIDAARRRHDISRTLLPHVVVRHARSGRRGIERLRSLLEADELPASDFERLVGRWLRANGIGGWRLHHRLVLPVHGPVEIDVAWPAEMVALELEGSVHVDRRGVHDHDTERQNHLVLGGWTVIRLTYRRWLRRPDAAMGEIEAALGLRR